MFDNVAFEVVIGLVFIYLLYSLLITILGEIVATQLGIRARLLRIAVERMLNDGYYQKIESSKDKKWQGWFRKIFLYEPAEFRTSFAGRFYEYPAIKYLARIEDNYKGPFSSGKPSYMSADYFAEALISFLMDKGNGVTDMDRIRFTLRYNTHNIQPKTLKQFRNLFETADNNRDKYKLNLIKWFNETMDRANGWHKRKMRFISFTLGFLVALFFNINSIHIAQILSNDKQARDALVKMGVELSKDSARYATFVTANGDSVRASEIVDSGYARIQKDIREANYIMGLGWQTDTLTSLDSTRCEPGDAAYPALAAVKDNYNTLHIAFDESAQRIKDRSVAISRYRDTLNLLAADTLVITGRLLRSIDASERSRLTDSLRVVLANLQSAAKQHSEAASLLSKDSLVLKIAAQRMKEIEMQVLPHIGSRFVGLNHIRAADKGALMVLGSRRLSFVQGISHVLGEVIFDFGWAGLLLTGIALSMGAPFWFDLLNKLVSVRGVGIKPEEKKPALPGSEPGQEVIINGDTVKVYTSDPVEYAIYLHRDTLEAIPGVMAVNYDYFIEDGKKSPCIEVSVNPACNTSLIPPSYDVLLNNETTNVRVIVTQSDAAALHFALQAKLSVLGVQNDVNRQTDTGWGTVTGVVRNCKTKKQAILCCSHVLRGHFDEVDDDAKRKINDHAGTELAALYYYVQSNILDAAYADLKGNAPVEYPVIDKFQEVVRLDAEMETEIIMNGFVSGAQQGNIISHRTHFPFQVNGKFLTMVNLVKITRREGEKRRSISTYGDSGALVRRRHDNMPLAMIIGGTEEYSFAITLKEVFDSLYIEPLKS